MSVDGLVASFSTHRGSFALNAELSVAPGHVTAIVGPNGAGKSTLLRTLAGLVTPTSGTIRLDGVVLDDVDVRSHVSTTDRQIGIVFQDYLLFPHLTALENVMFGPRARGMRKVDAIKEAGRILKDFGLIDHAGSRPAQLSGGQAQRVALARALITRPRLLLLDEPLAALDASVRPEVRANLSSTIRKYGGATVLVTHDAVDAMTVADEIIVLEDGAITHRCAPDELVSAAHTAFAADLLGLNFLSRPDHGSIVFPPVSVRISQLPAPSERAYSCVVVAVERGPSGLRVQLRTGLQSGLFWAEKSDAQDGDSVLHVGDRVWAEHPLFAG